MINSFNDFYKELVSDQIWFELLRAYREETIRRAATKVYAALVADGTVNARPWNENRKHVYNICIKENPVCDKPKGKDWHIIKQEEKEAEEKTEWVPLTGEARAKKLAEYKAMIDAAPKAFTTPKLSAQEIANEGDWLPKKDKPFVRSEFESQLAFEEHKTKVASARRRLFLDAYPDATEEEINEYIKQFKVL